MVAFISSLISRSSFEHIPQWMSEAKRHIDPHRPVFALVGCKADLIGNGGQREVKTNSILTILD